MQKVNPVGRVLSEVERAYLAGLFDGDGAIMACLEKHNEKKFGYRVRLNLKVTFSRMEDARMVQSMVGGGHVRRNRLTYDWETKHQGFAQKVLKDITAYLRVKRKQGVVAQRIAVTYVSSLSDLKKVALLADTLASFNVRSRNRRKNYASMIKDRAPRND